MWRDLRQSLRTLGRRPGFAVVAILTLAIGIGANVTIFGVVDSLLIKPLPFEDPERIVRVEEHHESFGRSNLTGATFVDLEERQASFAHVGTLRQFPFNFTDGTSPEKVSGAMVSRGFFGVFGVAPVVGWLRTFPGGGKKSDCSNRLLD